MIFLKKDGSVIQCPGFRLQIYFYFFGKQDVLPNSHHHIAFSKCRHGFLIKANIISTQLFALFGYNSIAFCNIQIGFIIVPYFIRNNMPRFVWIILEQFEWLFGKCLVNHCKQQAEDEQQAAFL